MPVHRHVGERTLCPKRLQLKLKQKNQIRETGGKEMGKHTNNSKTVS